MSLSAASGISPPRDSESPADSYRSGVWTADDGILYSVDLSDTDIAKGRTPQRRRRTPRRRVSVRRCLKVIVPSAALIVISFLLFFLNATEETHASALNALPSWVQDAVQRVGLL